MLFNIVTVCSELTESDILQVQGARKPAARVPPLPALVLPSAYPLHVHKARGARHLCGEITSPRHCDRQPHYERSLLRPCVSTLHRT